MSISMTKESRSRSRTFSELIPAPSNIRAVFEKRHGKWDPDQRLKIYGNKQWHQANNEARFVVDREPLMDPTGVPTNFKPIEGIEKAYDFVAQSYVEYVMLLQLMTASLRHLLHPQKRLLFKRFIEAVACRVCELKIEMIKLSNSLIHNLNKYLTDLGMTPDELLYNIPPGMLMDMRTVLQMREKTLNTMVKSLGDRHDSKLSELLSVSTDRFNIFYPDSGSYDIRSAPSPTSNVRSRSNPDLQGITGGSRRRTTGGSQVSLKIEVPVSKTSVTRNAEAEEEFVSSRRYKEMLYDPDFHKKVRILKRYWRKWIAKQELPARRERVHTFLNMKYPLAIPTNDTIEEASEQTVRQAREDHYFTSLKSLRQEYMSGSEAAFDMWALKVNLEQWVVELRDLQDKLPQYPNEEEGGCLALFTDKTVEEVVEDIEDLDEKDKPKKGADKDQKKKEKPKEKDKKDKDAEPMWEMPKSASVPEMQKAIMQYVMYWNTKLEPDNPEQGMDLQLAKEAVRAEYEDTIRKMVDAMMVTELDRMRAIDREPKPKPEKVKPKKEKPKKVKKDPLGNRSTEEIFAELIISGIIVNTAQVTLNDIKGAPNFTDPKRETYYHASPLEIKMALRELFGMPLCSPFLHSSLELRNSVLLAGPKGVGKTLMVHGLCRETGANLYDLSPAKMVGRYPGKKQEDYLLSLLMKVTKEMEPSVILVDECHLLFPTKKARKRPDVDKDKPTRWVRLLTRLMKKCVEGDRILLIGITNEPFFAKTAAMCKLFQNVFFVPYPEYGTRLALWQHFTETDKMRGRHSFNLSSMAKLSEGMTGKDIKSAIAMVCTATRLASNIRVRQAELIPAMAAQFPSSDAPKQEEWVEWYLSTPMMRARQEMLDEIFEREEAAAQAAKKK